MPIIKIELLPGRTHQQKAEYVAGLTKLTSEILKCPVEAVDIIFVEVAGEDWAHGGKFYGAPK